MAKQYKCVAREGMSSYSPIVIEARSPKEAAYFMGRQLGYQCKQTLQGRTYDYITKTNEFNSNARCCVAVYDGSKVSYYNISQ